MKTLAVFFCAYLSLSSVLAQNHPKTESDLRKALFDDQHYDKLVRPVRNPTDTIPVRVNLSPVNVKSVDVDDKQVKITSWLVTTWVDSYLTWNPSEYGGLAELRIPASEVWIPDLSLYYAVSDEDLQPKVRTNVVVYSNGTVLWVPPFTVKSNCPPIEDQVTADTFKCSLLIGSWTYDSTLLDVKEKTSNVLEDAGQHFLDNHEKWTIDSVSVHTVEKHYACCENAYPVVYFDYVFKKKTHQGDHLITHIFKYCAQSSKAACTLREVELT